MTSDDQFTKVPMEIEEWKPEPPCHSLTPPPRRDRSTLIICLSLVGMFIGTLAFEGRHELAEYARQHYGDRPPAYQSSRPAQSASSPLPDQSEWVTSGNAEQTANSKGIPPALHAPPPTFME